MPFKPPRGPRFYSARYAIIPKCNTTPVPDTLPCRPMSVARSQIVIVDGERSVSKALGGLLRSSDMAAGGSFSRGTFLGRLSSDRTDCAVSALHMPELTGTTSCSLWRPFGRRGDIKPVNKDFLRDRSGTHRAGDASKGKD